MHYIIGYHFSWIFNEGSRCVGRLKKEVSMKINQTEQFQVGGSKATFVLIICSLLYAVNYMDRQVMAVVLQPMKIDLGLSDLQMGVINSMFYVGVIFFCMPIAHFVDVWSRKKLIGLMALGWSAFTLATGFAGSYIHMIFARLGVGIGESGFTAGGTALIAASYPPEKRAFKLGIFNMFITVGLIFGFIGGGYISANMGGWRVPFYMFAIPGVILGILAFFMQDYTIKKEDGSAAKHDSFMNNFKTLLKVPTLRWLYLGAAMFALVVYSAMTWIPALLMRSYGIKEDKAGLISGIVGIMSLIGAPLGGFLADKWQKKRSGGRMRLAAVGIILSSIMFMLTLTATFDLGNKSLMIFSFIMLLVYGIVSGLSYPAMSATTQDVVTPNLKGLSAGTSFLALVLGGVFGPVMVGGISKAFGEGYKGLSYALYVTSAFGVLAAIFWWKASRHIDEDMKKVKVN
jgi:MFS family permease